jgi:predicted small integral membrane protein
MRMIKILLSLSVAVWAIAGGIMNLLQYQSGVGVVATVLTLEGNDSIRAVSFPIAFHLGYAFIYLGKFTAGFLCVLGTLDLWKARTSPVSAFESAKKRTVLGCGVAIFFLFFGFFAIAGTVFNPAVGPPSELREGFHRYALYFIGAIGLISLYISGREIE